MKHHGCAKVMSFQMRLFWQISLIQRLKFTESRQGLEAPTSSLSGYFFFHVDMLPTLDGTTFQEWFLLVHHLDQNVATSSKLHPYLDSSTQKCPKKVPISSICWSWLTTTVGDTVLKCGSGTCGCGSKPSWRNTSTFHYIIWSHPNVMVNRYH